jgi:hypothetical protein
LVWIFARDIRFTIAAEQQYSRRRPTVLYPWWLSYEIYNDFEHMSNFLWQKIENLNQPIISLIWFPIFQLLRIMKAPIKENNLQTKTSTTYFSCNLHSTRCGESLSQRKRQINLSVLLASKRTVISHYQWQLTNDPSSGESDLVYWNRVTGIFHLYI